MGTHGWSVSISSWTRVIYRELNHTNIASLITVNERNRLSLDLPQSCGKPRNVHVHGLHELDDYVG